MSDMRKLIESVERLHEARGEFDAERIIQSNGGLTNVNINRELPSKLYTGITGSGYGPDDVVKIYYRDQERLDSWLASSQGRRAEEVTDTVSAASDREGRRIPSMGNWGFRADHDAINRIFDSKVRSLGRDPALSDIKNKFDELRSELESGNHDVSRRYSERQFLGAVAKQIRVEALFNFDGKNITMAEKDDSGNYKQAGGASERLARSLADRGLFPQEAEGSVGALGGLAGGLGYSDEDRAQVAGVNASRQGQQRMRTQARRFLELLAKRNQGTTVSDGITYISSLARLLTEALTDEEEREFQELLLVFKDTSSLDQIDDEETKNIIQQARDAAKDIEPQRGDSGDDLGNAPTQTGGDEAGLAAADGSTGSGDGQQASAAGAGQQGEGMSLADFAQSGKGGIKNDPGETRAITELQEFLKTMGWDITADGRYGPQTTAAVKEFQQLVGLTDDGDAGPQTIEKILVWGRLPDVKTWSAQLKELNELITAGAVFSTEQPAQQQPSAQNSSIDFRSLISIVESLLSEAVTPQQQARAMELYNALKAKLDDGEYQSGLPQELQTQFSAVGEWARGAATGSNIDAIRNPSGETPTGTGDGAGVTIAGQREAYKVVTGTGQSRRYTVYDASGRELSNGRGPGPAWLPIESVWRERNPQAGETPPTTTTGEEPPTTTGETPSTTTTGEEPPTTTTGSGYNGNLAQDQTKFFQSEMAAADAEAFLAAIPLNGKSLQELTELDQALSRMMSILNGNQRIPDAVGEPNGGTIASGKDQAVSIFRRYRSETLQNAMRTSAQGGGETPTATSTTGEEPPASISDLGVMP